MNIYDYQRARSSALATPSSKGTVSSGTSEIARKQGALDIDSILQAKQNAMREQGAQFDLDMSQKDWDRADRVGRTDLGFGVAGLGLAAADAKSTIDFARETRRQAKLQQDIKAKLLEALEEHPETIAAALAGGGGI